MTATRSLASIRLVAALVLPALAPAAAAQDWTQW